MAKRKNSSDETTATRCPEALQLELREVARDAIEETEGLLLEMRRIVGKVSPDEGGLLLRGMLLRATALVDVAGDALVEPADREFAFGLGDNNEYIRTVRGEIYA